MATLACFRRLTHGDAKPMEAHFRAHVARNEPIPDVPFEPPIYAYDDWRKSHWAESLAAKRRFERSDDQVIAERFAWLESAAKGRYIRDEAALEAAGKDWLSRNAIKPEWRIADFRVRRI